MLFGEYRSDEPEQGGAVREDPDHVGAAADFLVQPLFYPALRDEVNPDLTSESAIETLEMIGQRLSDTLMPDSFIGPSP
ncbi:hypothetical protein, partial [Rhodococcus ruber]|uniref:hypothetical protein n=1 Tax=Rhodococcus ruber TaxID=1830 RepID=UPI00387DC867